MTQQNIDKSAEIAQYARQQRSVHSVAGWNRIAEWLLFALVVSFQGIHTLPVAWEKLNTDFPNYYLTARLAREVNDTSRIYEWIWIQRQKDHRQIDQTIVGLGLITPLSTLVVWPFAAMQPLDAKHYWLLLNFALILAIAILLRSMTLLSWRRILLVIVLSVPLSKNILFGQYYVLLLFILTLACWCYIHQRRFMSGLLVGVGFGLKIFPLLYLGYFLRKKDKKSFAGGIIGSAIVTTASIIVFGWQTHRVFFLQISPWAFRGEAMDPYNVTAASLATLLHRLFVYEPQWNPAPTFHSPWMFTVLLPLVQTLLFAPAILLAKPNDDGPGQLQLEWSALLLASLAISTLPASYHFTLLILPVCLMWSALQQRNALAATAILFFLYISIGYPWWQSLGTVFRSVLLTEFRLYFVIMLCFFSYKLLAAQQPPTRQDIGTRLWVCIFVLFMSFNIFLGLRHQRGLYEDYQWRVPTPPGILQANNPVVQGNTIIFTAMFPDGYHTATQNEAGVNIERNHTDQLALAANSTERWTEQADQESTVVSNLPDKRDIPNAETPVASADGRWLAFLREDKGRGQIWLRALEQPATNDKLLSSPDLNVSEMSFFPNGSLIFSAEQNGGYPRLFVVDQSGKISSLGTEEVRYPAVSPDGHWFAYSQLQSGNWHLWLRDLRNGQTNRLTEADCNNMEPAWTEDSKTLIYASDCGRALWFTALCRRPIPQ